MASDFFRKVMGQKLNRELADLDTAWARALSGECNAGTGGYAADSPYLNESEVRAAMYEGEDASDPAYGAVADIYLHGVAAARHRAAGQPFDDDLEAALGAYLLAKKPMSEGGGGCSRNASLFDNRIFRHTLEDAFGKDVGQAGYSAGGIFAAAMSVVETLEGLAG